ncbi:BspA family leucine-rich repeat surface protein [Enterococcus pingfangensis]|uniref:BspA family leucine-rich repeat surface protein n=1 Tax=Enterococcus pingfangensis TaxID=2559924 RepID=UPI0010F89E5E|nr:BspA family leucine-rich repeat surface protein [Enterococcus pingfangensis]
MKSIKDGRTFTWKAGDVITLPALTYTGAYGNLTPKFSFTDKKISDLGTLNGNELTMDKEDTGEALTIEVTDVAAENIDVKLPTPNLANPASTAKFLDSEFAFNVIASPAPKLAAAPAMASAAPEATTTLSPWKAGADVNAVQNTGTYGATYTLTDGAILDFSKYVVTGKEFLDSVEGDPNTIAKTPVLKKGIFGTVKWYISTDGVLHLGPGIMGTTSKALFPNIESPWNQYYTQFQFAKIKIEGEIFLRSGYYLFGKLSELTQIDGLSNLNFTGVKDSTPVIDPITGKNLEPVRDLTGMFQGTSKLTKIEGTSAWDLSSVVSTSTMFSGSAVESLDTSGWGLGAVTSFASMFNSASSLTTIIGTKYWDTKSVDNMVYMFSGATSLKTLDVSTWNTGKVKNLQETFRNTSNLETLDVSTWNTSAVTTMQSTFSGAAKLKTLDVSNWSTGNVQDMANMFAGMSALTSLDVSRWDTTNVGVKNLETDATKPARYGSMSIMFKNASNLESLTLGNAKDGTVTSWNTANVANMTDMFLGTSKLSVITFGKNFNTAKLTNGSVALPNTTSTVKWKNVGEGTLSIPRGTESLTAYAGKVSDTYVLAATDRVGIDVTVQDSLGNPLANVEVTLYKEDGSAVATIKTNSEGKASFSPQPYGKYSVKQITDLTNFSKPAAEQIELSSTTTGFKKVTLINNFKQMLPPTGSATRLWVVIIASLMIISSAAILIIRVK